MNITIIGAGGVGFNIANMLTQENHNVTVIDIDARKIANLNNEMDLMAIEGNGASPQTLKQVKNSDMIIAVTNNDEINILACLVAKNFNIDKKIARVSNSEYFNSPESLTKEQLGIDLIIDPEKLCAQEIINIINFPESTEAVEFAGGDAKLIGVKLTEPNRITGKKLIDLREEPEIEKIRFIAISRNKELVIPHGDTEIKQDDTVYIMGHSKDLQCIYSYVGIKNNACKKALIGGAGRISEYLAQDLENAGVEVKIIEKDHQKAREISSRLKKTLVLEGSITDSQLQISAGVEDTDFFISLTDDDETNILSCVLAKKNGAKKVIPLIRKHEYTNIVSSIAKIDIPVGTKMFAINAILKFLRKGVIGSVAALRGVDAEVLEMTIDNETFATGKSISELKLPKEVIIGIVIRDKEVIIPTGNLVLQPADKVAVFTKPSDVDTVEKLFTKEKTFSFKSILK